MVSQFRKISLGLVLSTLMVSAAQAHTGLGSSIGFAHGFGHPLGGVDHTLAMIAVGMFAAYMGARALWLVPSCFVAMMCVGGALGMSGIELPLVEMGIAMSIILLGAFVALQTPVPTSVAMGIVGLFALFHGHAHGTEMFTHADGLSYTIGFMQATSLLHIVGIALGLGLAKFAPEFSKRVIPVAGGAMVTAGGAIFTGHI